MLILNVNPSFFFFFLNFVLDFNLFTHGKECKLYEGCVIVEWHEGCVIVDWPPLPPSLL